MFNYFKTVQTIVGVGLVVEYWKSEAEARSVTGANLFGEKDEGVWVQL